MTDRNSMEVRFVELMSQLFQLDEAERLDFGVYRIIKRHKREVSEILGQVLNEHENNFLTTVLRDIFGPHNQSARCFVTC